MAGLEGAMGSGLVGKWGRKATQMGFKKKLFGETGTDFGGFFSEKKTPQTDVASHGAAPLDTPDPTAPLAGAKRKRKGLSVNSAMTPSDPNTTHAMGGRLY
jgi:hypothetical protein